METFLFDGLSISTHMYLLHGDETGSIKEQETIGSTQWYLLSSDEL